MAPLPQLGGLLLDARLVLQVALAVGDELRRVPDAREARDAEPGGVQSRLHFVR